MSGFEVKVHRIEVSPHPAADALEVGRIPDQDFQFIIRKGSLKSGDLFVYVPEQALVPDPLIAEMGLEGRLHGAGKNRVKAVKLRGLLSQGLAYSPPVWPEHWVEGLDVGDELGITKYEIQIPVHLAGKAKAAPAFPQAPGGTLWQGYTDLENIKKYPHCLEEGEQVFISEKLHGTCFCAMVAFGERFVSSLGIARRGMILEDDGKNVYWEAAKRYGLFETLERMVAILGINQAMLFGEIIGVQDLKYGFVHGDTGFAAFDLLLEGTGFLPYHDFVPVCIAYKIPMVPLLYRGPYSAEKLAELTAGNSVIEGAKHIREGVVVRPAKERQRHEKDPGRAVFKSINPDYLTRRGGSEFH